MIPYFHAFETRAAPDRNPIDPFRQQLWFLLAGIVVVLGVRYLWWRWTVSINWEAAEFSMIMAAAETLAFLSTLLFFYDIWQEGDTEAQPAPKALCDVGADGDGAIRVDIYITTYDEPVEVVRPSIEAALALTKPENHEVRTYILDDGARPDMAALAEETGTGYITRNDNRGFKAGNLRNALFTTRSDFVAICDADTRLFPSFLVDTMGYFRDPQVAWVQTPHWFYDIPEGLLWSEYLDQRFGKWARPLSRILPRYRHRPDPFLVDPAMFFDVIQRRRNRHGASFCCGAGSIHRREAVFEVALHHQREELEAIARRVSRRGKSAAPAPALFRAVEGQPFRFHVSEDIYSSILAHQRGWRSVYHPKIEARMLSPQTADAWAAQILKYAGGTFDIMMRANPLFKPGMPLAIRLHYAATFLSYLSVFSLGILLFAPVFSLLTGLAPVSAYTLDFFIHLLPLLMVNELAAMVSGKGHDSNNGRVLSVAALPITIAAFWKSLRARPPRFRPTPKLQQGKPGLHHFLPNAAIFAIFLFAAGVGIARFLDGDPRYQGAFLAVNLFWLTLSSLALIQVAVAALCMPAAGQPSRPLPKDLETATENGLEHAS